MMLANLVFNFRYIRRSK